MLYQRPQMDVLKLQAVDVVRTSGSVSVGGDIEDGVHVPSVDISGEWSSKIY